MTIKGVLLESGVLSVFVFGLLVSWILKRRWHPAEIIVMAVMGLLFEVLTEYMWEYHDLIFTLPLVVAGDISFLFPFAWGGLIMAATATAEWLWKRWKIRSWMGRHMVLAGCWLVIGNLSEFTYYNVGLFNYARTPQTEINFWLGQIKPFPPFMIMIGYGIFQPFVSRFFQWMEAGIRGTKSIR